MRYIILLLLIGTAYAGWVSPTGHVPGSWTDEANAYDNDTTTYASTGTRFNEMELTISATSIDSVKLWCDNHAGGDVDGKIEVYYSGAYHQIHDGNITASQFVKYAVGSTESITGARLTLQDNLHFDCYEFYFREVTAGGATADTTVFGGTGSDTLKIGGSGTDTVKIGY